MFSCAVTSKVRDTPFLDTQYSPSKAAPNKVTSLSVGIAEYPKYSPWLSVLNVCLLNTLLYPGWRIVDSNKLALLNKFWGTVLIKLYWVS